MQKYNPEKMIKNLSFDALNFKDTERFGVLINCTNADKAMIKRVLEDPKLSHRLTTIDVEKLKILLDKLNGNCLSQIIKNPLIIKAISMITCEKLSLLFENNEFNHAFIVSLLKYKEAVDLIISIDIQMLTSLLKNGTLYNHIITELFGINNPTRLDKLALLLNSEEYCEEMINQLMIKQKTFDEIDSIEIETLKILLYNCKVNFRSVMNILRNQNIIAKICNIEIEKLRLVFYLLDGPIISKLLNNQNVLDGIGYMDHEKFKHLLYHQLRSGYSWLQELLEDQATVYAINALGPRHFHFLLKSRNLHNPLFMEMLKERSPGGNKNLLLFFSSNSIRTTSTIVNEDSLMLDLIVSIDTEKLKLLIDFYFGLKIIQPSAINFFNELDIEKVKILISGGSMPFSKLKGFYEINDSASMINSIENEKLKFLVDSNNLLIALHNYGNLETIQKIDMEKLSILNSRRGMIGLITREHVGDPIASFDTARLKLLVQSIEGRVVHNKYAKLIRILKNKYACKIIHSMEKKKLEALIEDFYGIQLLYLLPAYKKTLDFITLTSVKNLKQALAMIKWNELVKICKGYEGDVIRNLNFAMLLFKYGNIDQILYNFVRNNEAINNAITELFPLGFPIDQMLINSEITEETNISSLKDMCIQSWMDQPSNEANKSKIPITKKKEDAFSIYMRFSRQYW